MWRFNSRRGLSDLGDGVLDNLLVGHIALVANEQLVDALGSVSVNLLKPLLDVVERVHVGDIVDDADTVGTTVVGGSDGAETLLAGSIPLRRRQNVSICDSLVSLRIFSTRINSRFAASPSFHQALSCGFSKVYRQ